MFTTFLLSWLFHQCCSEFHKCWQFMCHLFQERSHLFESEGAQVGGHRRTKHNISQGHQIKPRKVNKNEIKQGVFELDFKHIGLIFIPMIDFIWKYRYKLMLWTKKKFPNSPKIGLRRGSKMANFDQRLRCCPSTKMVELYHL